jgi:protein-tyrosine phosphatase
MARLLLQRTVGRKAAFETTLAHAANIAREFHIPRGADLMANETAENSFERIIALDGGRNFRDLGGYPAADGRHVRWGVLFRSGTLAGLTQAGWAQFSGRNIRTVCDLRTMRERRGEPFAWAGHESLTYWAHDYRLSFAELGEAMRTGFPTVEAARAGMIAGYRDLPYQLAPAYTQLFACLKAGELQLVFNCAAGKDRAGTAAALILTALGVPREVVVEDYLLTNKACNVEAMLQQKGHFADQADGLGAAVSTADPAYIEAALDTVERGERGLAGFLEAEFNVNAEELQAIRNHLLE